MLGWGDKSSSQARGRERHQSQGSTLPALKDRGFLTRNRRSHFTGILRNMVYSGLSLVHSLYIVVSFAFMFAGLVKSLAIPSLLVN